MSPVCFCFNNQIVCVLVGICFLVHMLRMSGVVQWRSPATERRVSQSERRSISETLKLFPIRVGERGKYCSARKKKGLRRIDWSEKRRVICQPTNLKEEKTFELDCFCAADNKR